ncbi:MAG: hypothetical protein KJZ87_14895 [Thermoguttaceae bacterium]|nr:hypothetical protein [Thermoguttaceae bacterium]
MRIRRERSAGSGRLAASLVAAIGLLAAAGCGSGDTAVPAASAASASPIAAAPVATAPVAAAAAIEGETAGVAMASAAPAPEAADPAQRSWKDAAGNVLAVGEFVSVMDGQVCIQEKSGVGTTIPLEDLSAADRDFVKTQGGEIAAEPAAADTAAHQAANTDRAEPGENEMAAAEVADELSGEKVVIPFDFVSNFDKGDYGSRIGDLVWKKIDRDGGFIVPGSMVEVREFCETNKIKIGPETPLEEVAKVVRNNFQAQIAIWGQVERAPGHQWEVYDLAVKCADFSGTQPEMIYEVSGVRTESVSEIPHKYLKEMFDKLYERSPAGPAGPDPIAEKNWLEGPNLVVGGDFESGANGVPAGWESRGGHYREPLGNQVAWGTESGNYSNKVIRFTFPASVGDSEGVPYYSGWFPIEAGATYRFQCRYRTNGPSPKVFIKCYDEMGSEYSTAPTPSGPGGEPQSGQWRECYRSQMNLKGDKNQWHVHTEDFTPRHTKYTPKRGRVMLYAYLGGGVVEWDDVVLKQIVPASPGESKRVRRHSMESTVTIEEMESNEARAAPASEKQEE